MVDTTQTWVAHPKSLSFLQASHDPGFEPQSWSKSLFSTEIKRKLMNKNSQNLSSVNMYVIHNI